MFCGEGGVFDGERLHTSALLVGRPADCAMLCYNRQQLQNGHKRRLKYCGKERVYVLWWGHEYTRIESIHIQTFAHHDDQLQCGSSGLRE